MPIRGATLREVIAHADLSDMDATVHDARYLKLDQTTPQTVISGMPTFDAGIRSNGYIILKSGQRLVFDGT